MRGRYIIGNWKMNPETHELAAQLLSESARIAAAHPSVNLIVCPPHPFIGRPKKSSANFYLGAQDAFWAGFGAYTGEVSASMVESIGARFVIVGHSERRALGDTDEIVAQKLSFALKVGLSVILCVGERMRDHEGAYLMEIGRQLATALAKVPRKYASRIIIAYEPIWAIGKQAVRPATAADVLEMGIYIKRIMTNLWGAAAAESVCFIYGGSVDAKNARDFLVHGGVKGLLVGRESLYPKSFEKIVAAAENI